MTIFGVLPASGKATRIGGIPKFALPIDHESKTLIERQVELMAPNVDRLVLVTRERWLPMIQDMKLGVDIITREPSTMNDALKYAADQFPASNYLVGMPDTYFSGINPYPLLVKLGTFIDIGIACWEITNELKGRVGQVDFSLQTGLVQDVQDKTVWCKYPYMWGALNLSREVVNKLDSENAHPGIDIELLHHNYPSSCKAIAISGSYFDVGTISGYLELLKIQHTP